MTYTLDQLNQAPLAEAEKMLDGLYEHTPWIVAEALKSRPFHTLSQLKQAMARALAAGAPEAQLALIRAHPELAGKAMESGALTAESTGEQQRAGLTACTPAELARIRQLNADYQARFGFPFVHCVRGPRGTGMSKQQIIDTFERRLENHPEFERAEALRQINRIVEIRLADKFDAAPALGNQVWDWHEELAQYTDPGYAELGQLTVTYLTDAHRACAAYISQTMRDSGFDEVRIDAVGNVVGRYKADPAVKDAKTLLTGSHYDTVRNGGRYDGRVGIFVPIACVRELARTGRRLPFDFEVVGFAEEEGQRYKATFIGSGALVGDFKPEWLDQKDADGITMREAMQHAGLDIAAIPALRRNAADYLGHIEVHIEQGPVINEMNLPLAVVTSINGSARYQGAYVGQASHAGTTPMGTRRDAACATAELALYLEQRAAQDGDSVGTMGMLQVPSGSVNVVPGRCEFSLDIRAPHDAQRDAVVADVLAAAQEIAQRRGVRVSTVEAMRASAAPSDPALQKRWEDAVAALGLPVHRMPSGAGHDAMKLHEIMPQAMLFVRGENAGISHNPLESSTADDLELAVRAMQHVLDGLARDLQP
ncbi:MAG TPA: 2-oxo-4-hydroxy-4-carboxy-5-ureidoimidazoline decarboxylase [Ottowia sp.]|uniref:2-oxo-4-hydroxy-4-carboxy-5-ureidoimidazoline decarboxylase n=1 Tax=Ottowia sp. TaxID=1898956 RepID=UPI002B6BFC2F|nr:2-oxo-4-hydroxy-4-carboxy-5-ureidoimidazoline decarboxylase [Ottowia sp.]HMN22059.1 2-oxo-4-hydroxy-4-carboxy-5-ureidoimidazoline decarboxylase [Ottowia sp.]